VTETSVVRKFLDLIVRELDTDYELCNDRLSDLSIYMADLSPLRLRLSTVTPCIQVTADDIHRFGKEAVTELVRQELIVRQDIPGSAVVLVEKDGRFLNSLGKDPYWTPVLDEGVIQRIMHHPNPKRAFLESLCAQIPLRFLSPYEPNLPVAGSQFYGRSSEITLLLSHPKRSFAIEGGRRIGKTSLLKEVKRREVKRILSKRELPQAHVRQIVRYDFWGYTGEQPFFEEVVRHFGEGFPKLVRPDFASYFPRFIARMSKVHNGRIIFMFDEVDDLIKYERKTNYRLLGLLKRIAQAGDCRLIIAGFRELSEECNRFGTPLSFCQRVRLHNLNRDETMSLVSGPMASMGVRLQREVFPQILNDTGGHPQLVQLYCQALVEILDAAKERTITTAHVRQVKRTGRLYDTLVETLIDNITDLEFALVYGLADRQEFGLEEINEISESHNIHLSLKQIHGICRMLESIGVISRRGQADTYQFSIPLQPALARKLVGEDLVWHKAQRQMQLEGVGA
jgi:hypothetical protein